MFKPPSNPQARNPKFYKFVNVKPEKHKNTVSPKR